MKHSYSFHADSARYVPLQRAKQTLVDNGVDPLRPDVQAIFERYLTVSEGGQPTIDFIALLDHEPHSVVAKALTNTLAMPNWPEFTSTLKSIFGDIRKEVHGGAPATYIPILAEANRDWFSVSVCTVDGQQFSYGDTDVNFSIQSCVKPLMYGVAARDRGLKFVHRHVGFEPSGLAFNEVSLNQDVSARLCFQGPPVVVAARLPPSPHSSPCYRALPLPCPCRSCPTTP